MEDLLLVAWQYYMALLHPSSPVRVASSLCGGLGLFLREDISVGENKVAFRKRLWGVLFEIPEEDFEHLQRSGYPSLYCSAIMGGPLSLANHQCDAPLCFTPPRKLAIEEFEGMRAVFAKAAHPFEGQRGEELVVNYAGKSSNKSSFFGGACRCTSCGSSKEKDEGAL